MQEFPLFGSDLLLCRLFSSAACGQTPHEFSRHGFQYPGENQPSYEQVAQLWSCGGISDLLGRKAFINRTNAILTSKVIAEVVKCKAAICQPCFRLLRRD